VPGSSDPAAGGKLLYRLKKSTRYYRDNREDFITEGDNPKEEIPYLLSCLHYRYRQLNHWWSFLKNFSENRVREQARKAQNPPLDSTVTSNSSKHTMHTASSKTSSLPPNMARIAQRLTEEENEEKSAFKRAHLKRAVVRWNKFSNDHLYYAIDMRRHAVEYHAHHQNMHALGYWKIWNRFCKLKRTQGVSSSEVKDLQRSQPSSTRDVMSKLLILWQEMEALSECLNDDLGRMKKEKTSKWNQERLVKRKGHVFMFRDASQLCGSRQNKSRLAEAHQVYNSRFVKQSKSEEERRGESQRAVRKERMVVTRARSKSPTGPKESAAPKDLAAGKKVPYWEMPRKEPTSPVPSPTSGMATGMPPMIPQSVEEKERQRQLGTGTLPRSRSPSPRRQGVTPPRARSSA